MSSSCLEDMDVTIGLETKFKGGKMTKLKDLRKMKIWDCADIIILLDVNGNEIEINSESKRKNMNNKEVVNWESEVKNGLDTLTVVLNK